MVDPAGNVLGTLHVVERRLDGGVLAGTLFCESIDTIVASSILLLDFRGGLGFGEVALDLLENDRSRGTGPEPVVKLVPYIRMLPTGVRRVTCKEKQRTVKRPLGIHPYIQSAAVAAQHLHDGSQLGSMRGQEVEG